MPKGGCPIGAKTPPMTGTGGATAGAGACTGFLPFFFCKASRDWRWACSNFCILAICSFMAAVWALVFFLVVEGGGFCGLSASAIVAGSWSLRRVCFFAGVLQLLGARRARVLLGALEQDLVLLLCLAALATNSAQTDWLSI